MHLVAWPHNCKSSHRRHPRAASLPHPATRTARPHRYKCVCATRHTRLLSRASRARYNSTLRIQDLISPKCALPSRIVKEQHSFQPWRLPLPQSPRLNAVVRNR